MHPRHLCFAAALAVGLAPFLSAQTPDTPPAGAPAAAAGQAARPPYKPKNLQVLPQDADLRKIMRGYADALGVKCEFCHVENGPVHDMASDAKQNKQTARIMIRMTEEINTKYLATVPDRMSDEKLGCGTCHRGHKQPEEFVPPPHPEGNGQAPAATPPPSR